MHHSRSLDNTMVYGSPNFYEQRYTMSGYLDEVFTAPLPYFNEANLVPSQPIHRTNWGTTKSFPENFQDGNGRDLMSMMWVFESDGIVGVGVSQFTTLDYPDYPSIQSGSSTPWYPHFRVVNDYSGLTGGGDPIKGNIPDIIDLYRAYFGAPAFEWTYWKGPMKTPFNDFRVFFEMRCALGRLYGGGYTTPIGSSGHESEWVGDTDVLDSLSSPFYSGSRDWIFWNVAKIPQDTTPTGAWWRSISGDSG